MPRITEEQRRYNLEARTPAEMRRDLVVAFDRIHQLRENKLWLRIVSVSAVAEWGLIILLLDKLADKILK
jgi:hypothetical protein